MLAFAARAAQRLNLSVAQAAVDMDALHLPPLQTHSSAALEALGYLALAAAAFCALLGALRVYFDNGGVLPLSTRCVSRWREQLLLSPAYLPGC